MKCTYKHAIVGVVCILGAVFLFGAAVWWGTVLLESAAQPTRVLLNRMIEDAGKSIPQDLSQSDGNTTVKITLMIAALAASAGFGLARALFEFQQCLRPVRSNGSTSEDSRLSDR